VTWPRVVGTIAAALLLAVGLDNARLRRDLALQQDVMSTLQQPNVLVVVFRQRSASCGRFF